MKTIFLFPFKILTFIFGSFNWAPPQWLSIINMTRKERPSAFWGVFVALILIVIGYQYYLTLPKPVTVKAEIYSPGLTEDYEDASPDNLLIQFKYDFSKLT